VLGIRDKSFGTRNIAEKRRNSTSRRVHQVCCIFINLILYALYAKYVMSPSDTVNLESPPETFQRNVVITVVRSQMLFSRKAIFP